MTLVYVPFYLQNYKLLSEHVLGSKELTKSPQFSKACASCLSQTNHRQHTHSILAGLWCIYFPSKSQLKFGEYLPGVSNAAFVDKLQKLNCVLCSSCLTQSAQVSCAKPWKNSNSIGRGHTTRVAFSKLPGAERIHACTPLLQLHLFCHITLAT